MDTNPSVFPRSENPNPKRKQFRDLLTMTHAEFLEASKRLKEEAKGLEEPILYDPSIVSGDSAQETSHSKNLNPPIFTEEIMAYLSSPEPEEPQHATICGNDIRL